MNNLLKINRKVMTCPLVFQTLTNVAEAPEGRKMLSEQYITLIEGIHVCKSEVLQRHKQTLLDVVRWRP